MTWAEMLAAGFVFGLANSAHCMGMCGVFAFQAGGGGPRPWLRLPLYFAGKTCTYVFMGTVAGWAGAHAIRGATSVQAWIGVLVGALLVLSVGRLLLPARAPSKAATAWAMLVEPFFRNVRHLHETGGPFALGAATGALPCGVSYLAALQAAALGSPLGGAAMMAAFGLGTVPALVVAGLVGRGALARLGPSRLRVAGAVVVVATGVVAIARSAPSLMSGAGAPACCSN
jgi:sulfite exporter TauE/SafE